MAIWMIRRATIAAALAALLAMQVSVAKADENPSEGESRSGGHMTIGVDEARIVRLNRSAGAIIVGNPLIADVAVQENGIIVVVGKNYGTTNLIALDQAGKELTSLDLTVRTSGRNAVSLFRGTGRHSLNCSPRCEMELDVGDEFPHFEGVGKSVSNKLELSSGVAESQQ